MTMFKSALLALSLTALSAVPGTPAFAETAKTAEAATPIDPARLKAAENVVIKLVPPGTYQRIMKDMMDSMAGSIMDQILGMDAATMAAMAGEEAKQEGADRTLQQLASEKDPHFRERMDIMMKVMFTEMGVMMAELEPEVRTALSNIYAKKYTLAELNDIGTFFATPSGASFAGNFMSTFTDKEMIQASFGMMPKIMEAMPAIMQKVEAATAHLPPPPKASTETEEPIQDAATSA
jgi:hypothetical protein